MRALPSLLVVLCAVGCAAGCADTTAPAWPSGASIRTEIVDDRVELGWPAPADERGVAVFVVRIDERDAARLGPEARAYGASELAEASVHAIEVVAIDESGTASVARATRVTMPDRTPPVFAPQSSLSIRAEGNAGDAERAVELSWPAATDAAGVARYRVTRDAHEVAAPTSTSLRLEPAPLISETQFSVVALDAAGNASAPLALRWDAAPQARSERLAQERAAVVMDMLLGSLGERGAFADVLAGGAVTGNSQDVLSQAQGVGVAEGGGSRGGGVPGGGGAIGGLGGLRGAAGPPERALTAHLDTRVTVRAGSRPAAELEGAIRARGRIL
ncbi:MAG: hypothetical protein IT378_18720, partial [Sandaracinaceae bacterium]|nr:hypothetical protein [Sandaracinaceae bacterium]